MIGFLDPNDNGSISFNHFCNGVKEFMGNCYLVMLLVLKLFKLLYKSFLPHQSIATSRKNSLLLNGSVREVSNIDFVHEKRHMDIGRGWEGLAPVTFVSEKSWKMSIFVKNFLIF